MIGCVCVAAIIVLFVDAALVEWRANIESIQQSVLIHSITGMCCHTSLLLSTVTWHDYLSILIMPIDNRCSKVFFINLHNIHIIDFK